MITMILAVALAVPTPAPAPEAYPDANFYKVAAEGNLAEVQLGDLAQQKSADEHIKQFAAQMVSDHNATKDRLNALASSKSIKLPSRPSLQQRAVKTELEALSGAAFDKSYLKHMIKDHETDIKAFDKEASTGADSDAKAYAAAALPTLRSHLEKVKALAAGAGLSID